ncbi:sensor histidine kinase [Nonomuraea solani]|uniref:sensor histidine kinase n=1 Tax=Nonomuraea solani TaxID=1144553 RepID=UPI001357E51A|nr:sensor histidine kinase [Nonomuraea solani]
MSVLFVPWWAVVGLGAVTLAWFAVRERAERLAVVRERRRIAQDMHDELGHDLNLIALAAGALKLAPDLPESHRASAQDLRARAGHAVDRLGEIVGVLHEPASVESLVEAASAAGLPVTLRVDGTPKDAGRTVYRVVQEGLTNAAKHAPGAPVTVRISHTPAETHVVVENGPAPRSLRTGGGRGLTGLDERVRRAGGTLTCGPSGAGFTVEARLPHRPNRSAARILAVALVAAALTGGGLRVWEVLATQGAVLAADEYAALRPGQIRTNLALPSRQAAHRSSRPGCEYYAMTSNPFHDRYGDTYRLCFDAGRLVSADALVAR